MSTLDAIDDHICEYLSILNVTSAFKFEVNYGKSGAQLIHAHITSSASITHTNIVIPNESF